RLAPDSDRRAAGLRFGMVLRSLVRALAGEKLDLKALCDLEREAAVAAAKASEEDRSIEITLVRADGTKQPLDSSGSSGGSSPPFATGSFAPRSGGTDDFSTPTPDELRRVEQQNALEVELDTLRRAQTEMQERLRKQPVTSGQGRAPEVRA